MGSGSAEPGVESDGIIPLFLSIVMKHMERVVTVLFDLTNSHSLHEVDKIVDMRKVHQQDPGVRHSCHTTGEKAISSQE